jgi:hypothetical protein
MMPAALDLSTSSGVVRFQFACFRGRRARETPTYEQLPQAPRSGEHKSNLDPSARSGWNAEASSGLKVDDQIPTSSSLVAAEAENCPLKRAWTDKDASFCALLAKLYLQFRGVDLWSRVWISNSAKGQQALR